MATVIDRLVVELGLDPAQFTKGQKAAAAAQIKSQKEMEREWKNHTKAVEKEWAAIEAAKKKALKELERAEKKAADEAARHAKAQAEAYQQVANKIGNVLKLAVGMYTLFTAGKALGTFTSDVTSADAALGRLAKSIGSTPQTISALDNAVRRAGGATGAGASSFEHLSDAINEIKTTGNSSMLPFLYRLQGMGGKTINLNKELAETFGDIAENAKNVADKHGIPFATYLLKQAGIDKDTAALLLKGRAAYNEALEKSNKLGIVRKEDVEAAQNLQTTIEELRQSSENLGRSVLTEVTPTIVDLLKQFQGWIEKNKEWIRTGIVDKVKEFAHYLAHEVDWPAVGEGIKTIANAAALMAKAFGGALVVIKSVFAAIVAFKGVALAKLLGSLFGVTISGAAAPIAGVLAGVSVGSDSAVPNAEKPGVITRSDDENTGAAGASGLWGAISRGGRWLYRKGTGLFGGGGAEAHEGGAGIRARAARAGSHHAGGSGGGSIPAVPDTVTMTPDERNTLGLILKHESHGRNVMNHVGEKQGLDPNTAKGYTAQGYYQLLNTNWRRLAPGLGIKTTNAMSSSLEDQTRVALALLRENPNKPGGGVQNWSNYNPALRAALARGDKADVGTVPNVAPSTSTPATPGATSNPDGSPLPTDGKGVNNDLMKVITRAQEISEVKFHIHEGLRTLERQKEMVDRKWSTTINSKHLTGRAVDLRANGDPAIGNLDRGKYERINAAIEKASKETGIPVEWGGNWKGFKDIPHFQLPDSYKSNAGPFGGAGAKTSTLDGQRAGAMAAIAQVQAAQAAMVQNTTNDNRSTSKSDATFNGGIHVTMGSGDAGEVARNMHDAVRRRAFASAANYARA